MSKPTPNVPFTEFAAETAFSKFTRRYVLHARDLARSGQKDAARDWHRYFTNAQVVKHIHAHNLAQPATVEQLAQEIADLGHECHPLDVANWATDIQAIRACLESLVKELPRRNLKRKTASRLSSHIIPFEASISRRDLTLRSNNL